MRPWGEVQEQLDQMPGGRNSLTDDESRSMSDEGFNVSAGCCCFVSLSRGSDDEMPSTPGAGFSWVWFPAICQSTFMTWRSVREQRMCHIELKHACYMLLLFPLLLPTTLLNHWTYSIANAAAGASSLPPHCYVTHSSEGEQCEASPSREFILGPQIVQHSPRSMSFLFSMHVFISMFNWWSRP